MTDNEKEKNDLSLVYLEQLGVHLEIEKNEIEPEKLIKSGYKEIPNFHFDMLLQQMPGLVTHGISHRDTYRVVFDKSLGVLQKTKDGKGYHDNIVPIGKNNKIIKRAVLEEQTKLQLMAHSLFSAL